MTQPRHNACRSRHRALTARQLIGPGQTLAVPVRLELPFPLDVTLSCRPDGGHRDHERDTLVFSCTADEGVRTERVDLRGRLAGVEEVDVQTGVRLNGVLSGELSRRMRPSVAAAWQATNEHIHYTRTMEIRVTRHLT